jgi:hypothetical protein
MKTLIVLWLAVAFTPEGPVAGQFDDLQSCKAAVSYARMQQYPTTDCLKVTSQQATTKLATDTTDSLTAGGWTVHLVVYFKEMGGEGIMLGFNDMAVCNEIRANYLKNPNVDHVSECLVNFRS